MINIALENCDCLIFICVLCFIVRSLFISTSNTLNRNLVRYSLTEDILHVVDSGRSGFSTHLALDVSNKTIYSIHFSAETTYNIYKTSYDGVSTRIISDQTGLVSNVDITVGENYFYVLDSANSEINRYNKSSDTFDQKIVVSSGTKKVIIVVGK